MLQQHTAPHFTHIKQCHHFHYYKAFQQLTDFHHQKIKAVHQSNSITKNYRTIHIFVSASIKTVDFTFNTVFQYQHP
jgi:S-methylmethionine-dependent homocysteine/selenocysteine methylase